MEPYEVNSIRVQDASKFASDGTAVSVKRVTYRVGVQGPFTLDYLPSDYNAEKVRADMQKEVDILKAIGATQS